MAYNNVNAGLDRTIDWSGKHHIHGHPEALWTKIKNLKALFSHDKELYASKEVKSNALASEGNHADQKFKNHRRSGDKRVMTCRCETSG